MNDPRPLPSPRADDAEVAARVASTVRADVRSLSAYPVPKTDGYVQLHANENAHPLPYAIRRALAAAVGRVPLNRYPDGAGDVVKQALAAALPVPAGAAIVLGNGSDELIQLLTTVVARPGASVLAPEPTFVMYRIYAKQAGVPYVAVPLRPEFTLDEDAMLAAIARERPALVWLASPNNPTGHRTPLASIERILGAAPGVVVVDEAYADFGDASLLPRVLEFPNLVVLRTLSKVGLAGARLGYAVAHPAWIAEIDKVRSPYNVNALTQAVVPVVLEHAAVLVEQVGAIRAERLKLAEALARRPGVTVFPSDANFLMVRVPDADAWAAHLKARRILVKNLDGSHRSLDNCLRITVGTPDENVALLAALDALP
ncbi:MAG TPA: histidinol-phosphate transaminase [Casimicrobiaceae bacterium]|nr:histidinol-phosphate transaminase [Casimicrobiaceae bacterium]